ncbi:MAG: ABC transporter substrate-binding protein [Candidatus Nezhaarchaeales archaeon]
MSKKYIKIYLQEREGVFMGRLSKWLLAILVIAVVASIGAIALVLTPYSKPATTPVEVRISYQPSWHHATFFVMVEKGWLEKIFGDQVKITIREISTGPEQMTALVAGELDVVYVGATPPLPVIAKGFGARIVAVANTEGSALVSRADLNYQGPSSLVGRTVSTYPPGSIQHTLMNYWLKKNNIDPGTVKIIGQSPADQLSSFVAGAVDAILTPDPHTYTAVLKYGGKIVVTSDEMWPKHPCCIVLMTKEFIDKHRDLAAKFVALHIIASEYIMNPKNREDVKGILLKWLPIEKEVADYFPGSTRFHTDPRDQEWRSGLDLMCQVLYELGRTANAEGKLVRLRVEDVVDTALYEEALKIVPQIKAKLGL